MIPFLTQTTVKRRHFPFLHHNIQEQDHEYKCFTSFQRENNQKKKKIVLRGISNLLRLCFKLLQQLSVVSTIQKYSILQESSRDEILHMNQKEWSSRLQDGVLRHFTFISKKDLSLLQLLLQRVIQKAFRWGFRLRTELILRLRIFLDF